MRIIILNMLDLQQTLRLSIFRIILQLVINFSYIFWLILTNQNVQVV